MSLKIAITGSSGFVGSALMELLKQRNVELLLLRRPGSSSSGVSHRGGSSYRAESQSIDARSANTKITEVHWDPSSGVRHLEQLEGLDAVIHLAGRSIGSQRWSVAEKRRLRDSRVQATERLAQQLCQLSAKPKMFLGASAIGIYGDCGDQWITESSASSNDFLGELAKEWEQASQSLVSNGVRVAYGRLGIVLGLGGGALAKMLPIFRWGVGGVLGGGRQYWSWISLEDCCRALLHLVDHEQCSGPFNLVSPDPVTNRQFTKSLGKALHRPTVFPAPAFALRLAMGEMADALLLTSCRVRPERLQQCGFSFADPNLDGLLAKLL